MAASICSTSTVLAELRRHNLSNIARCLGVKKQAVSGWQQVPATRVRSVSEITGIPAWRLRPDIFEAPEAADQ